MDPISTANTEQQGAQQNSQQEAAQVPVYAPVRLLSTIPPDIEELLK